MNQHELFAKFRKIKNAPEGVKFATNHPFSDFKIAYNGAWFWVYISYHARFRSEASSICSSCHLTSCNNKKNDPPDWALYQKFEPADRANIQKVSYDELALQKLGSILTAACIDLSGEEIVI